MARKNTLKVSTFDAADYLKSEADMAAYLQASIDEGDGDPELVLAALGDIARARGMMKLSQDTGLSREGLYKAFSGKGNPSFDTVSKVARSMGLKISFEPRHAAQ
jgi:probable addiction module antidote protein